MPELPEVELLVRYLAPSLTRQSIARVGIRRERMLRPDSPRAFKRALHGATFTGVGRRGKYVIFELRRDGRRPPFRILGHLGMTGRMFIQPSEAALPRHTAVVLGLDGKNFVFQDTRYFGRLTLDLSPLDRLGPEPLGPEFTDQYLFERLKRSSQAIKVRLLDQSLVAGLGNIYASEALFLAGIPPQVPARRLTFKHVRALRRAIQAVLRHAIASGSTVRLNWSGGQPADGLFYYGREAPEAAEERLRVYDREGAPCVRCRTPIRRVVQAARSTFYCPRCQSLKPGKSVNARICPSTWRCR